MPLKRREIVLDLNIIYILPCDPVNQNNIFTQNYCSYNRRILFKSYVRTYMYFHSKYKYNKKFIYQYDFISGRNTLSYLFIYMIYALTIMVYDAISDKYIFNIIFFLFSDYAQCIQVLMNAKYSTSTPEIQIEKKFYHLNASRTSGYIYQIYYCKEIAVLSTSDISKPNAPFSFCKTRKEH